jgi:hypothetical protein
MTPSTYLVLFPQFTLQSINSIMIGIMYEMKVLVL